MSTWRYTAIDVQNNRNGSRRRGEMTGNSAADVRASLRRVGLQVIDIKPIARRLPIGSAERSGEASIATRIRRTISRHMRSRRRAQRCELFDSLATMIESGMPLLDAVQTVCGDSPDSRSRLTPRRTMLVQLRDRLRSGAALDQAMTEHPTWFDGIEIAMVRAGQHGGELPRVLESLAQQHERSGELGQKLISALAYPAIIAIVGLGVVIFLSVKTLPDLTSILVNAGVEVPALTERVMISGQLLAANWHFIMLTLVTIVFAAFTAPSVISRFGVRLPQFVFSPSVIRRMAVGRFSLQMTDLIRTGVPIVEALRVLEPTVSNRQLRAILADAANGVERGDDLSTALAHPRWFDSEYRRLLEIGQAAGELDVLLERLGLRYQRQARRLIDQLAALLEPCVMLVLAVLVGIVVMAAVLPLIRLQEVL